MVMVEAAVKAAAWGFGVVRQAYNIVATFWSARTYPRNKITPVATIILQRLVTSHIILGAPTAWF